MSQDREEISMYNLTITATNVRASPQLSFSEVFEIEIVDSNDNAPFFKPSVVNGRVTEAALINWRILAIVANDLDVVCHVSIRRIFV